MYVRQLNPILAINDKIALKNLIPKRQDQAPITQLRFLMELRNRDETVRESLFSEGEITFEQQIEWYKKFIFSNESGIFLIHTGTNFAGYVNFGDLDLSNKRCEAGIKVSKDFQSKGLGRRAFEFWLDTLFKYYSLNKIYLAVMRENERAMNLYASMGFQETATLKQHYWKRGKFIDCIIMTVFVNEFSPSTIIDDAGSR